MMTKEQPSLPSSPAFIHSCLDDAGLSPSQFRIYCHLARRAGEDGAYSGVLVMAKHCQMNHETARDALRELLARHMIEAQERRGKTTVYRLTHSNTWLNPSGNKVGLEKEGLPDFQTPRKIIPLPPSSFPGATPMEIRKAKVLPEGTPQKDIPPSPPPEPPAAMPAASGRQGRGLTEAQRAERDAKKAAMLEVGAIMHRQPETPWTDEEKKWLAKIYPGLTADTKRRVGAYYTAHWPPNREDNMLRHDVLRLVKYWAGELDRANAWLARLSPTKRERLLADPQPVAPPPVTLDLPLAIPPLPPPSAADFEQWKASLTPPEPALEWMGIPEERRVKFYSWVFRRNHRGGVRS